MSELRPEEMTPREWTEYQMLRLKYVIDGEAAIHKLAVGGAEPQQSEVFAWANAEEPAEVSAAKSGNSPDKQYLGLLTIEEAQTRWEVLNQSQLP